MSSSDSNKLQPKTMSLCGRGSQTSWGERPQAAQIVTWYHGTTEAFAKDILFYGFNHVHNWFSVDIAGAQAMGGPVVLAVDFDASQIPEPDEDGKPRWQMCVHEYIPPERITLYEST